MLSTNLDFMRPEGANSMVLATTSFSVSSGKTFLAVNLSACLADANKKVLLVDADLRKRSCSGHFGLKHHVKGLSNYISDSDLPLDEIIHQSVLPGVDFIPAGYMPPNPANILGRSRMDALIAELRERYEYIILDGVPVNIVADSLVINRLVDMNLFLIRSGQIDRRFLPELEEFNESGRLHNLCIVLNSADIHKSYGRYGYGYGYGYGSGYGSGYYGGKEK